MNYLREHLTFDQARVVTESANDGKDLFMKGICIQGGVKNANQRVYPVAEISNAVKQLNDQITSGNSVLGEVDHPDDLKINLDRVSHMITEMWMDGPNGYGKLKILPTPMGTLVKTMLESGVKLGVSSRGSGNVAESTGNVSDFEIVTVDVVAQPSAPNAYPKAIYEGLLNMRNGHNVLEIAREANGNQKVQKYLKDEVTRLIKDLKIQENIMLDAIKPLLDSDLINEDTKQEIQEAWEAKLSETKEEVRAELREEFARRYEHDKSVMVEALDRMVTENLTKEIEEFASEKKAISEDRAKFVAKMQETAGTFDKFLVTKLAEEVKELNQDRSAQAAVVEKLEQFVIENLAKEIEDFQTDRNDVVETKVRLVKEAREQFAKLKESFIERSAKIVQESVAKNLEKELTQLKEDIEAAKENTFGRKIFEAFASEFSASYLNENKEMRQLEAALEAKDAELVESQAANAEKAQIIESKEREVEAITESVTRKETMDKMLSKLNKEKGAIMRDLLESVQTSKLESAFDRYLPAVLDGAAPKAKKEVISESREVTGDKEIKTQPVVEEKDDSNIVQLRQLAGLK